MTKIYLAPDPKTAKIRTLNDKHRRNITWGAGIYLTRGVLERGEPFFHKAIETVATFSKFTEENDPYGEHDFGAFMLGGAELFWKIDYYAPDLKHGSEDPSDPSKTARVLTILLAQEY